MNHHTPIAADDKALRHDWTKAEISAIFALPMADLLFAAINIHRQYFDPNAIQKSQLLSIKTGGCPEDCGYCSQSAHFDTGLAASKLMQVDAVLAAAQSAKEQGASRFCMGSAWRNPKDRDLVQVCRMIEGVKALGLETCATLGMLTPEQAGALKEAGLDYYNHNLDTSEEHYSRIVTTRSYDDRLKTLQHVREARISVCCGGILGLGENREDRVSLLTTLANLSPHPESVPINLLVPIAHTPLAHAEGVDDLELVRMIATARIVMPQSVLRLSAGREKMSPSLQALCFLAGANSVFIGAELLTTPNPDLQSDHALFASLGVRDMVAQPG